ncbi:MAG: hypothetical protein Q9210_000626 [Variospora velana]
MALILAGKDRITVRTGGSRSIIEAIARYTKHSHLDHPDAQHIAKKEPPPPPIWTDPDIEQWAYIFPATHPNERVVLSPSLILSGGPTYGMQMTQSLSSANVRLATYSLASGSSHPIPQIPCRLPRDPSPTLALTIHPARHGLLPITAPKAYSIIVRVHNVHLYNVLLLLLLHPESDQMGA